MSERMTIRDIAGFCPEEAVWKMLADVSFFLLKEVNCYRLTPDSIVIDGKTFMVAEDEDCQSPLTEFLAPEQDNREKTEAVQMVWSLGAVAYFMATGHIVFGGHGSSYQKEHPSVVLPILPKDLHKLTPVLQKCLNYTPDKRIRLNDLKEIALKGLNACEKEQRRQVDSTAKKTVKEVKSIGEKWPEEMREV